MGRGDEGSVLVRLEEGIQEVTNLRVRIMADDWKNKLYFGDNLKFFCRG